MNITATPIYGANIVELDYRMDQRGFFARAFCARELRDSGLETAISQVNTSLTLHPRTLRGLHYQISPAAEVKLVRCIRGALFDVIVDLRPDSPSFRRWFGIELSASNRTMLYIPRGCAHGFITLEADVEALYFVSEDYAPEQERGLRYDDPWADIEWPVKPLDMSAKDRSWPDFDPKFHGIDQLSGLIDAPTTVRS